jgi:hypothetical protein
MLPARWGSNGATLEVAVGVDLLLVTLLARSGRNGATGRRLSEAHGRQPGRSLRRNAVCSGLRRGGAVIGAGEVASTAAGGHETRRYERSSGLLTCNAL